METKCQTAIEGEDWGLWRQSVKLQLREKTGDCGDKVSNCNCGRRLGTVETKCQTAIEGEDWGLWRQSVKLQLKEKTGDCVSLGPEGMKSTHSRVSPAYLQLTHVCSIYFRFCYHGEYPCIEWVLEGRTSHVHPHGNVHEINTWEW